MLGESSEYNIIATLQYSRRCCTKYDTIRAPIAELKYYVLQELTEFCNLEAIPDTERRTLCANPNKKWVLKVLSHIQGKLMIIIIIRLYYSLRKAIHVVEQ
uniref:Chemokine interleukin-8-like domain-containing protein n=1 Tax=Neogobius melanostomus TaxID=47308 RepID=A0A8C6TV86_9GOBI